jgi:hypothetical protein
MGFLQLGKPMYLLHKYRIFRFHRDRNSSINTATHYGLDGPGIETREREIFRTRPDRPWGPPNLLYDGYRLSPGSKTAGEWR